MDRDYLYRLCNSYLEDGICLIVFQKKDNSARVMLATKDMSECKEWEAETALQMLGGRSRNCTIQNGNIAIVDLLLGEVRSFCVDRLITIIDLSDREKGDAAALFNSFRGAVGEIDTVLSMENLDVSEKLTEAVKRVIGEENIDKERCVYVKTQG